jgi:hypothetical protein
MLKQVEENKRLDEAEQAVLQVKIEKLAKNNEEILAVEEQKKERVKDRLRREEEMMTTWLASEAKRREEEAHLQSEQHAAKCKSAREEMIKAIEEKKRQKLAQQAEDRKVVEEQVRRADEAQEKNRSAVRMRMEQIDKNCKTLGAQIAARDAEYERFMEERLRKALEEGDRLAKEDAENRKNRNAARVKKMIEGLDGQMRERKDNHAAEVAEGKIQLKIWQELSAEDERKKQAKLDKARKAREKNGRGSHRADPGNQVLAPKDDGPGPSRRGSGPGLQPGAPREDRRGGLPGGSDRELPQKGDIQQAHTLPIRGPARG